MKNIQSFWAARYISENYSVGNTSNVWTCLKDQIFSRILSCLQFHECYGNIELYTDSIGKKILIDELQLPYEKVSLIYDNIQDFELWALEYLYLFKAQNEPFIFVHEDVYLHKKLSQKDIEGDAFAFFVNEPTQKEISLKDIDVRINYLSNYVFRSKGMIQNFSPRDFQQGYIGYNNIDFLQDKVLLVFNYYKKELANNYERHINSQNHLLLNLFSRNISEYEKRVFNIKTSSYEQREEYLDLIYFSEDRVLAHVNNTKKKSKSVCSEIEYVLKNKFPDYYERALTFLNKQKQGMQLCIERENTFIKLHTYFKFSRKKEQLQLIYNSFPRTLLSIGIQYSDNLEQFITDKPTQTITDFFLFCDSLFDVTNEPLSDLYNFEKKKMNFSVKERSFESNFKEIKEVLSKNDSDLLLEKFYIDSDIDFVDSKYNWTLLYSDEDDIEINLGLLIDLTEQNPSENSSCFFYDYMVDYVKEKLISGYDCLIYGFEENDKVETVYKLMKQISNVDSDLELNNFNKGFFESLRFFIKYGILRLIC